MGRPGAGGSAGRPSSGGHTVSRNVSGHRVGGNSRPTTSSSRPTSNSRPTQSSFGGSQHSGMSFNMTPKRPTPPPPAPSIQINVDNKQRKSTPPPPPPMPPRANVQINVGRQTPPPPKPQPARTNIQVNVGRSTPPPPPPRPPRTTYRSNGYSGNTYNNTTVVAAPSFGSYVLAKVISTVLVLAVLLIIFAVVLNSGGSKQNSTIQRYKVESGNAYMNNNIVDKLDWIDNPSKLSSNLKTFFNKTGVVPYIYLKEYDPELVDDTAKDLWAQDYYTDTFDREDILLYVYFDAGNDYEIGYMCLVFGLQTGQVMDAEAEDIFWNNLDSAWATYDAEETDAMFEHIFNTTGNTIMRVSTTGKDIVKWVIIAGIVLIIVVGGIVFFTQYAKYKKAKAESDERILRTPIQDLADSAHNPTADLEDKYLH